MKFGFISLDGDSLYVYVQTQNLFILLGSILCDFRINLLNDAVAIVLNFSAYLRAFEIFEQEVIGLTSTTYR